MSEHLRLLATYVPPRIARAIAEEAEQPLIASARAERFHAAILFADVSGFTPLTEALAQKGSEGPEELTRLLNAYFTRMITLVEAEGGEVVKFSGDAMTVVFPAVEEALSVATRRAQQAAEAMQGAMSEFATLQTSVGAVALGMKISLGAGTIIGARVGGVFNRWEYVIAGDPLRQVAQAEHQAARGEIILSPEALACLTPDRVPAQPLLHPDWANIHNPDSVTTALQRFVPRIVTEWLKENLQAWLAVLRPMTVLFVGIGGLDYAEAQTVDVLHNFVKAAQETLYKYEGTINKLAVDDKGTVILGLLGAPPYAHENDPERAARCALELQTEAAKFGLRLAIGITTGRVFAGPVGSATRREYTVMGDTVNLAARLMSVAGAGHIYCDYETYLSAKSRLTFDLLPPMRVKGKAGLVRIYRPTGEVDRSQPQATGRVLVGRQAELSRLEKVVVQTQAGQSCILVLEGEAGIGKSRLVEEFVQMIRERGLSGLMGTGSNIEQRTPYRAWRDVFTSYFDLEGVEDPKERRRRIEAHVRDAAPELMERVPLLEDMLDKVTFDRNAFIASLDTQQRHESLVSLLLSLLRAWAAERPLVLVFEDAHWLDILSWDLTVQAARAFTVARVPFLLLIVMRPLENTAARQEAHVLAKTLADMEQTEHLVLATLSQTETVALAAARLGLRPEALPEKVAELVYSRADGNPFFAEELVYFFRDHGLIAITGEGPTAQCLIQGDLNQAAQTLPDTIQGVILSRIDRLSPENQLTLKVAAVIGRTFMYTALRDTLGEHMQVTDRLLGTYLEDLSQLDLTPLEAPEPELSYIFKHIITQEVAYETLLFAQRRQLHRTVALWYESKYGFAPDHPGENESVLPLLAFHWHQAEETARERYYAGLAGHWAASQYANTEAVGYLTRALELTSESDLDARYNLLIAREAVNDLRGERQAQANDLAALMQIAEAMNNNERLGHVYLQHANYAEVISDYPLALVSIQKTVDLAAQANAVTLEAEGYTAWGKVLWRQGNFDAAQAALERALPLSRRVNDRKAEAQSLSYLGRVYLYQGNHAAASTQYQSALDLYQAIGHKQGEADSLNDLGTVYQDLGDLSAARNYYERALTIYRATGDRRGQTFDLSNLGTLYCDLGDYEAARNYHEHALKLRQEIGDRWGEAVSLVNLSLTYHGLGDNETARRQSEQALTIQHEVGDRRGMGYSLTYLGHAQAGLQNYLAAQAAYQEALELRHDLGQHGLCLDDRAGLAGVALAQGDVSQAQAQIEPILEWIETNGPSGIEYPLQAYLTCYRVLSATANGQPTKVTQAQTLLSQAHDLLMKQALGISDPALRQSFLENVAANREIARLRPALPAG